MVGGWFRRSHAHGPGRGAANEGCGCWLLAGIAAALGAEVTALRALAGDATSLVVHGGATVQVLTNLDSGASVGAALGAGWNRDGTAR